jgi:CTP synthase (UTP-ammonia lyase)
MSGEVEGVRVGIIGDRDPSVTAHRATGPALGLAAGELGLGVVHEWLATETITSPGRVARFDGLWAVPATPYRSTDGALLAIRYAREHGVPFLGTCGGFQHAVLEYARNVLGWADAEHAELAPGAARAVIAPLACSLVEVSGHVRLFPGTRIAAAYGTSETVEGYHCNYGVAPAFRAALTAGPLRASAEDDAGDLRAVELDGHPFFLATLFQPERAALAGRPAPIVTAFVAACAAAVAARGHEAASRGGTKR